MRGLPPGPAMPATLQTLAWWTRPLPLFLRGRERFGPRWTLRLLGQPPFVILSDPDEIRQVFTAPPHVLHPGEGAKILEPVMGPHSVILLDEDAHLEQRRLMLPAFKGDRIARLRGMVTAIAEEEIERWPRGTPVALHPHLQALTLDIILRAVFGLEAGPRLDRLRTLLGEMMELASGLMGMFPVLQQDLGPRSPGGRFNRISEEVDRLLAEQVEERRAESGGDRDDVLAMLLVARHEDGSPMSFREIRDELVTALVAGHETTASQLAWALVLLARHPTVLDRLVAELQGDDDTYLDAVINEAMRVRPVLLNGEPRLVKEPIEIGGWQYPPGCVLDVNAFLVHHDARIYPEPQRFRPERFLERPPETYTFLPFGGGRRRCLGASFAQLEMRAVLRTLLTTARLETTAAPMEVTRRRSITISPAAGATVVLQPRAVDRARPAPVVAAA